MLHWWSRYRMLGYCYPWVDHPTSSSKFRTVSWAFNATSMILMYVGYYYNKQKNEISSLSALTQFDKSTYSYNRTYSHIVRQPDIVQDKTLVLNLYIKMLSGLKNKAAAAANDAKTLATSSPADIKERASSMAAAATDKAKENAEKYNEKVKEKANEAVDKAKEQIK